MIRLIKSKFAEFEESHVVKFAAAIPYVVFGILSDASIALSLCLLLNENRHSRDAVEKTNSVITKLIIYAINRFLLLLVLAVVQIIVYIQNPSNLVWLALDFVSGTLYANSLLASLNFRKSLRQRLRNDGEPVTTSSLALRARVYQSGAEYNHDWDSNPNDVWQIEQAGNKGPPSALYPFNQHSAENDLRL
ncbi:hypothetical protein GYMLUDRAFT_239265 [Collybiopsis luxurians FD-317 M1]|nr:hypothetical protein GYMLUDRAFT_239265 [Collybiopsis luxurians FD-317 M1]